MKFNKIDSKWFLIHSYYELQQGPISYCIISSKKNNNQLVGIVKSKILNIKPLKGSLLRKCSEIRLKGLFSSKLWILISNNLFEDLKFLKYKVLNSELIIIKDTKKTIIITPFILNEFIYSNLEVIKFNLITNLFRLYFKNLNSLKIKIK